MSNRAIPRWEQQGNDEASVKPPSSSTAAVATVEKTPKWHDTKRKDTVRNVEDFCNHWHDSAFFSKRQFRVNNMADEPTRFSLDTKETVEGVVKTRPEASFGVVDCDKNDEFPSALPPSILFKAIQGVAAVHTEVPLGQGDIFRRWMACRIAHGSRKTSNDKLETPSSPHDMICMSCFTENDDYDGTDDLVPTRCGHVVCRDCWKSYLDVKVRNAERICLQCPKEQCKATLDLLDAAALFNHTETETSTCGVGLWKPN